MNSTMPKPAAEAGKPPFRPIRFAEPQVIREDRADGAIVLRAAQPLTSLASRACFAARWSASLTGFSWPSATPLAPGPG